MGIRRQVVFGVRWVAVSLFANRIARFVTTVILARLLIPEMFGIVAMANIAIATIGIVRELGFGAAFIQKQYADVRQHRIASNTAFLIAFTLNTSLFFLCFSLAPLIADFFNSSQVKTVLRLMVVSFLIDSIITVPRLLLQKQLQFKKLAICEIAEGFSAGLVGISLALMNFGVWSLVFSHLSSRLIFGIVVCNLSEWRPRLEFNMGIAREMFSYGKFIWGFSVVSALSKALDKILIGRFWGAASLGHYSIAFKLCSLPTWLFSRLINRITFPAFSKLQADKVRLKKALIETLSNVSIISIPLALGLVAVSEEFIVTIYGEKWKAAIPLVKVLAFYGMTLSISSVMGPIFKAIGKPNIMFYTSILHHVILAFLLFLFRNIGVIGICYAVVIPVIISSLIAFSLIVKYLDSSYHELMEPVFKSGVSGLTMFCAVVAFKYLMTASVSLHPALLLVSSIIVGAASYLASTLLINRPTFNGLRYVLGEILGTKINFAGS